MQTPWIHETLILIKQGIVFGRLVMCNCKGSASPRKQKAKNEREQAGQHKDCSPSTGWKAGPFLTKAALSKWKATSEIRNVLCLKKLFLHSTAPVVAWHLPYLESFNW